MAESNGSSFSEISPVSEMVMICSSTKSVEDEASAVPGKLSVQFVFHFHRTGHDHEKKHDHKDDVDHRRDLETEVAFVWIKRQAHSLFFVYRRERDVGDAGFGAGVHRLRNIESQAHRDRRG